MSKILSDRSLSVQPTKSDAQDEDFLCPLMPDMPLTGRNATGRPVDYTEVSDPQLRKSFIDELEAA